MKAWATVSGLLQMNIDRDSTRAEKNWYSKAASSQIERKFRRAARSVAKAGSGWRGRSGKGGTNSLML